MLHPADAHGSSPPHGASPPGRSVGGVFISYARDDDASFVKRLYLDLTKRGVFVWWDRKAMDSRGRTFLQEIRDAIASVDRFILVVGPKAEKSAYVQAEWEFALEACKVVIPILRLGLAAESDEDYGMIPPKLANYHCLDFRRARPYGEALEELLRILGRSPSPLAELYGVEALPPHFVPRPEVLESLEKAMLADISRPTVITSARRAIAVQGMGGVGKSVLAAAFARACRTRRAFGDGVIWLRLGRQPALTRTLALIGQVFKDEPVKYSNPQTAGANLSQLLADKNCLLILDDVWEVAHAEPFVNALGERCRVLITTRNGHLVAALEAQEQPLDVMTDDQALKLLAQWSNQDLDRLPVEAYEVAKECGNLPLALAMIGAMVRAKSS